MPDFSLEIDAGAGAGARVCGVDEAGRGPLAGPVVAAAVILSPELVAGGALNGLDDSKRMTKAARDRVYDVLMQRAEVGVGTIDTDGIERLNILGATMQAMADAVAALTPLPACALIDGNRVPKLPCAATAIVKGDGKSLSIAAASVIAKVTRDGLMAELDRRYPGYGWARNAGYGTAEHLAALQRLGASPAHRKSFGPVRKILSLDPG